MNDRRRGKKDDRGIALISVLICVMLCFLLSATILRVSLLSYLQKGIARQSTTTFYENETYVDDIKLGVQNAVAKAFAATTSGSTDYVAKLQAELLSSTGATQRDKLAAKLASYISSDEVEITVEGDSAGRAFVIDNNEMVIKNVVIEYTVDAPGSQKDGYYSKIKTDIRIKAPYYIMHTEVTADGGGYSMMAANGAVLANGAGANRNEWGSLKQSGNLYFGYQKGTVTAAQVGGNWVVQTAKAADISHYMAYWMTGEKVIFNGDLYVDDHSALIFTGKELTVRGTIILSNTSHLVLGSSSKVTCRDIIVEGKSVASNQYTFAAADLINGPPVDHTNQNSERTKYVNNFGSSIDEYTGGSNSNTGKTKKLASKAGKIVIDSSLRPVSNVDSSGNALNTKAKLEGTGDDQYDKEMWDVLDVNYLNTMVTKADSNKEPKGYITAFNSSQSDNRGKWSNLSGWVTEVDEAGGSKEFPVLQGKKIGVNFGTGVQVINDAFGYVMIDWLGGNTTDWSTGHAVSVPAATNIAVNVQHPGELKFYGILFSRGQFKMKITGANLAIGQTFMEYYGDDRTKAEKVLLQIGKANMADNASNRDKCLINNCFKNGILSLLDDSGSGGSVTLTYTNDIVRNNSLNVVQFENWEKQ